MSRKHFLVVVAVLAVLAAAAGGVFLSDRSAWTSGDSRAGQKAVAGLKIADVAEITIRDSSGELHLQRAPSGWTVRERADFPADTDRVAAMLVALAEAKVVQSEPLVESQRARLELVEPKDKSTGAGTAIELKDAKGGALGRLLIGKKIMKPSAMASMGRPEADATGRYVVAGDDAKTVLAIGDPLLQVEAKPQDWLVKDLLRVEGSKTVSSSKGWTVTRNTEGMDWKLLGSAQGPDLQKATDLSSSFGWVNLVDVVADAKADTGLDRPVTIRSKTFDDLSYTLKIGKPVDSNYYVRFSVSGDPPKARKPEKNEKAEDKAKKDKDFEERRKKLLEKVQGEKKLEAWTYLVSKTTLAPLLRDRKELLPEKKKPVKKT